MTKIQSFNPSNQQVIDQRDITPLEAIPQMVDRARAAGDSWGQLPIEKRIEAIKGAYAEIVEKGDQLADLIHQEMGKTPNEAAGEVKYYTSGIDHMCEEVRRALEPVKITDGKTLTTTYYEPLGVCASITPWNFPFGMPHVLMTPSLLAGNTVLFKPSEEVFLCGEFFYNCLKNHLPQDVIQILYGDGTVGKALVESPVNLITFTGSQATGKKILETAGRDLKRVVLELGGKDALIVCEDADLEKAAKFAANNSFRNAGQVCVSTEKILVHEKVWDSFLKIFKEQLGQVKIGPMVHRRQKDHVSKQVADALKDGAVIYEGQYPFPEEGNVVSPLIICEVKPEMAIMKDETFGPIASVMKVASDQEAIEVANQGHWGLGGALFTSDIERGRALARKVKTGMIGINRGPGGAKGSPWVGARQSGFGFHGSIDGHRQMTQLRIISEPA